MGAILVGSKEEIRKARRVRKMLGGALRQAGIVAASAEYALDHNIERLAEDHANALLIAGVVQDSGALVNHATVPTNIVLVETPMAATEVVERSGGDQCGSRKPRTFSLVVVSGSVVPITAWATSLPVLLSCETGAPC